MSGGRKRPNAYDADFVVIGTGAGGATAAYVLSKAGHSVLMLEEGPRLDTESRPRALIQSMRQSMRDAGTQTTSGAHPMTILQGRMVGGSTAINSGIIWRTPQSVRNAWRRDRGLQGLVGPAMDAAFDSLDRELAVTQTQESILGANSAMMRTAAEARGLPGKSMHRNAARCRGAARCLQGCPHGARMSMDVSLIPRAERNGARVFDAHRATWLRMRRGRVIGVEGRCGPKGREKFYARARRGVIVAAGAIHSPALLLRRGFRGRVGYGFQSHPGTAVIGRFDAPVRMSQGATQGYEVPMRKEGFKLESLALPPELLAARIPGAGVEWAEKIRSLDHYAQWVVQVRMKALGRVTLGFGGQPRIRFEPTPGDLETIHKAICLLTKMMRSSGANEIHPGIASAPHTIHTQNDIQALAGHRLRPTDLHLLASHLFGTCGAGADPRTSVVDDRLQHHQTSGLYVMDASAVPTNLGVNPQHTIMAMSWVAAEKLA